MMHVVDVDGVDMYHFCSIIVKIRNKEPKKL